MANVKLKRRPTRKNVAGKRFLYLPKEISRNKEVEPGTFVTASADAENGIVKVGVRVTVGNEIQIKEYSVLLSDLAYE